MDRFRSMHEPSAAVTTELILRLSRNEISVQLFERLLRSRDRYFQLEMEASHYLHHVVDLLVEYFPDARFILTLRDPYTWLNSEINQNILTHGSIWDHIQGLRYGRYGDDFDTQDRVLSRYGGVYPVSTYLRYWSEHIEQVANVVPGDRLLILKTRRLGDQRHRLARFLNIDSDDIRRGHFWSGSETARRHLDIFTCVDAAYLQDQVALHCRGLMARFFPEISSATDALSYRGS
ncbi:MAG: sulfotransferase [Nitrosospira sp.]|nr:sulfotransferase [Nitrosospira sp.]